MPKNRPNKLEDVQAMIKVLKESKREGPYLLRLPDGQWFGIDEKGNKHEVEIDSPRLVESFSELDKK